MGELKTAAKMFGYTLVLSVVAHTTGCSSIVSKSEWPVSIVTSPPGATVRILNRSGEEVKRVRAPATVRLKSGAGFFKAEKYTIQVAKIGYTPATTALDASINGWYFGNCCIPYIGLVGLIVDPITGAMYRLDDTLYFSLYPENPTGINGADPYASGHGYQATDFKIVEYRYNSNTRKGTITVDIGDKGFQARNWVVKNIGMLCSSKNITLVAGDESFEEGRYAVYDESIQDGLLKISFEAVY